MTKDKTGRRFTEHKDRKASLTLPDDHPAAIEGRTLFPSRRKTADQARGLPLKCGGHQRKIGKTILKGRWKGMPIYTLTLEERATCPRSCGHWLDCYGNKMHHSERLVWDVDLRAAIGQQLIDLDQQHLGGFVVRLHILGDFPSIDVVEWWGDALDNCPNLHIYGYTHHRYAGAIGEALSGVRQAHGWHRFAMRFSDELDFGLGPLSPTVETEQEAVAYGATVCPAQTEKTAACVTCGLCWQTPAPIAFLRHGGEKSA